jgi:Fanconi-associated nuclease 1
LASAAVHRLRCRDDLEHLLACLALTDRMEAGLGTSATASVVLSAADEAHARLMHLAAPDTAWEMGGGSASFAAAVLARAVLAGCAQLRRDGRKPDSVARLRSLLGCDVLPCAVRAGAFMQLVRDLNSDGSKLAALRLCEAAHATDGRLRAADCVEMTGPMPPPAAPAADATAESRYESPYESRYESHDDHFELSRDTFELSRAQMVAVRRMLQKLAVAPRRWKKPKLPELRAAREVRISGREMRLAASVRDEVEGGAGRRTGWEGGRGGAVGVEDFAMEWYLRGGGDGDGDGGTGGGGGGVQWTRGVHLENGLFLSTFALLLWDCLFAPTLGSGAVAGAMADAPLDLLEDGGAFYRRRVHAIEATLEAIERGEAVERWDRAYKEHYGEAAIGVQWGALDTALTAHALEALGGAVVSTICRTLALDYVGSQHGAPDLLLLAPPSPSAPCGAARFVEVKGPGDALRDGQLAWIDVLVRAGAEVDVAYVQVG